MGYLGESWMNYDAGLVATDAPAAKRECMRIAFYLGVKTMLDAMLESAEMERPEFMQFMKEITDEWQDFQLDCAATAFAMISERITEIARAGK
ncbi:hypothetical protein PUN4_320016 [Paraburkholderia unamae]|uniref:hypothetical protein n=1 Tax=Paraburkholderia unamae TaxID=219649 RepID=UPI001CB01950|nr:hypothetical protein [Paraburkholderia unamae]CAG9258525.1 hypothetical protein PUN4_320016 [Paraburkholderia unamae]